MGAADPSADGGAKGATSPLAWLRELSGLVRILTEGGVVVGTPRAAPSVLTVLQLDGDVATFVAADILLRFPDAASQRGLVEEHLTALAAALPALTDISRPLLVVGTLAAGGLQLGAAGYGLLQGWSLDLFLAQLGSLAPLGLRWAGRPVLRWAIRWVFRYEMRRRRAELKRRFEAEGIAAFRAG